MYIWPPGGTTCMFHISHFISWFRVGILISQSHISQVLKKSVTRGPAHRTPGLPGFDKKLSWKFSVPSYYVNVHKKRSCGRKEILKSASQEIPPWDWTNPTTSFLAFMGSSVNITISIIKLIKGSPVLWATLWRLTEKRSKNLLFLALKWPLLECGLGA